MPKIEYIMTDDQETYLDDAVELKSMLPVSTPREAAKAAADQYHARGGWERSDWPLKFEMYFDGESRGVFEVDLDFIPEFTARSVTSG